MGRENRKNNQAVNTGTHVRLHSTCYDGPTQVAAADFGFASYAKSARVAGKLDDSVTVDKAIDWIDTQVKNDRAFCTCLNLQSSHFPYELSSGQTRPFQPGVVDFDASFLGYPKHRIPEVKNAYYNSLHYIDQQLGRLVDFIRQSEIHHRTLIVVLGDNGESFYEHGLPTHGGLPVQPQVNVALVMNCPSELEPGVSDYLTEMVDVVPTVLAILDAGCNRCGQGIDVLAPTAPDPSTRLAFVHCRNGRTHCDAVISATGWKYTVDRQRQAEMLHNVEVDVDESTNFAVSHRQVAMELRKTLHEWRRRQLLYYSEPAYYACWYPPPAPTLSASQVKLLTKTAPIQD